MLPKKKRRLFSASLNLVIHIAAAAQQQMSRSRDCGAEIDCVFLDFHEQCITPQEFPWRVCLHLWLAKLFLLDGRRGGLTLCAEGAPHQRHHGASRPNSRFGVSRPGADMLDDTEPSSSYFERNEISPPPLMSRRRAQTDEATSNNNFSDLDFIIENVKYGEYANARLRAMIWLGGTMEILTNIITTSTPIRGSIFGTIKRKRTGRHRHPGRNEH